MKKIQLIVFALLAMSFICQSAEAGIIGGGIKGIGKGTKAVFGCVDRGVKGVGKGIKTTFGCIGKGFKTVL